MVLSDKEISDGLTRKLFEAYDADGGGTIDPEEFADLLEACRPDMTPEERTATFSQAGLDPDEPLDLAGLNTWCIGLFGTDVVVMKEGIVKLLQDGLEMNDAELQQLITEIEQEHAATGASDELDTKEASLAKEAQEAEEAAAAHAKEEAEAVAAEQEAAAAKQRLADAQASGDAASIAKAEAEAAEAQKIADKEREEALAAKETFGKEKQEAIEAAEDAKQMAEKLEASAEKSKELATKMRAQADAAQEKADTDKQANRDKLKEMNKDMSGLQRQMLGDGGNKAKLEKDAAKLEAKMEKLEEKEKKRANDAVTKIEARDKSAKAAETKHKNETEKAEKAARAAQQALDRVTALGDKEAEAAAALKAREENEKIAKAAAAKKLAELQKAAEEATAARLKAAEELEATRKAEEEAQAEEDRLAASAEDLPTSPKHKQAAAALKAREEEDALDDVCPTSPKSSFPSTYNPVLLSEQSVIESVVTFATTILIAWKFSDWDSTLTAKVITEVEQRLHSHGSVRVIAVRPGSVAIDLEIRQIASAPSISTALEMMRHELAGGESHIAGMRVQYCTPIKQVVSSAAAVSGASSSPGGPVVGFSDPFVKRLNSLRATLKKFDCAARQRLSSLNDRLGEAESQIQRLKRLKRP